MALDLFQPQNAFAMFSPDQWSNQFSNFNNQPIPFTQPLAAYPGGSGWPTDAYGNPIQMPPGMTLNSPAAAPATPAPAAPQQQGLTPGQMMVLAAQAPGNMMPGGSGRGPVNSQPMLDMYAQLEAAGRTPRAPGSGPQINPNMGLMDQLQANPQLAQQVLQQAQAGRGAAAPAAATAAAPAGGGAPGGAPGQLTYQQYLQLLSNPGPAPSYPVTSQFPQAKPGWQPVSGMGPIQNFMSNFTPAKSGPGSSFQQAFANAMRAPNG
jgi:hypothetical protein